MKGNDNMKWKHKIGRLFEQMNEFKNKNDELRKNFKKELSDNDVKWSIYNKRTTLFIQYRLPKLPLTTDSHSSIIHST